MTDASTRVLGIFLAMAERVETTLGSQAVAKHWQDPSALEGYSVAGLAGHLARGVLTVEKYLEAPASSEHSDTKWEWCADWFLPKYYRTSPEVNPTGPTIGAGRVMRGGSYLCHDSYCNRYRVSARTSNTPESSSGNCGFRPVGDQ